MNCPTCGSAVRVAAGHEGTCSYEPLGLTWTPLMPEYVELQRAAVQLLGQYELEEDEHGFPFNFALRDAHRELQAVLRRHAGGESGSVA